MGPTAKRGDHDLPITVGQVEQRDRVVPARLSPSGGEQQYVIGRQPPSHLSAGESVDPSVELGQPTDAGVPQWTVTDLVRCCSSLPAAF